MRTRSIVRRSVALTAATALLSGGLASGVLATAAYAAPNSPAVLSTISTTAWDNRSTADLTITGSNFINSDPSGELNDEVDLVPVHPDATNEVGTIVAFVDTATPPNANQITVSIPLAMAAPGAYKVHVLHVDGTPSDNSLDFSIYSFGPANASSVAFGPNASTASGDARGARPLDIKGSNIAVGAKVAFLRPNGTVDGGLTFRQGNPGNKTNPVGTQAADGKDKNSGYPSATLLQGNYDYAQFEDGSPNFTPGLHTVRVYNTNESIGPDPAATPSGTTATFSQPYFPKTGVSPSRLGPGSQNVVLSVAGAGFLPGSTISISAIKCGGTPPVSSGTNDVTVGAATVSNPAGDGTYNKISAPVSLSSCAAAGQRTVSVNGPDGSSFSVDNALTIGGAPHITSIDSNYAVLGQGAKVGYGADGIYQVGEGIVVQGTNFVGQGETDVLKMTAFDFGPGVTVVTRSVGSGSALVTIDVAEDATVSERTVRATNPDGGSTTTAKDTTDPLATAPFEVAAGPHASTITPSGFDPSQAGTGVTVKGAFVTADTYTVSVNRPAGTVNISGVSTPDANTLTFSMSTNGASPGPMDVTISDSTNLGHTVCVACMGINSLSVFAVNDIPVVGTASAPNTGTAKLTFQATDLVNKPLTSGAGATMLLSRQVSLPGQDPIMGTAVTAAASGKASATFDLTNAAPGRYNGTIADGANTWTCTGCFTVSSAGAITISVAPATAGQGVMNRVITVTGTNFARGMQVSIPNVTVHDLALDQATPTTKFTFQVDVADDAVTGPQTMVVTAGDGSSPAASTGSRATATFTINGKPMNVGDITPATYAQGAGSDGAPVAFSLTADPGTLQAGAAVTMGPGITVTTTGVEPGCTFPDDILSGCTQTTPDTLSATIVVAQDATADKRSVTVTNPDGGSVTVPEGFEVAAGPKVTSVANAQGQPVLVPDGVDHTITILGSGFLTNPKSVVKILRLDGTVDDKLTYDASTATVEAGKITLTVKAATDAALAARRVSVTNPDALKGYGSCDTCLVVAKVPGAPGSMTLTPLGGGLKATWTAAAANGSPVTAYHLVLQKVGSAAKTLADVSGTTLTHSFTGLTNGASYTIRVNAVNVAGQGPAIARTGIAGVVTTLTNVASTTLSTAGSSVLYSGKLTAGTAPVAGRTVQLRFTPTVGSAYNVYVHTNTAGGWSYARTMTYTVSMKPVFGGDATYRPSTGPTKTVSVRSKVVVSSPSSSSTSSAATTLKVTGYVSPNKHGKTVYLYRFVGTSRTLLATATLSSSSTYTFSLKPSKGTYALKVYIGTTTGNLANYSPSFTVKRV